MPELTPRERVLMAVDHTEPDRPPTQVYLTPEMHQMLVERLGRPPHEAFEVDFRTVGPRRMGPIPQPDPSTGLDSYDEYGTGYKWQENAAGGKYLEPHDRVLARLQTMDDVEAHPWPSADDYDYSEIPAQIEDQRAYAICLGGAGTPDIINGVGFGRGMEQVLCDLAMQDEVGIAIIDRRVEYEYERVRRGLEAGGGQIDILCLGEDLGSQDGPTMSPRMYDEFFRPRHQRFIDLAHDYGARAMLHSCGSTRALQPRLIEMGLDILDSVQPEPAGMDPEGLKRDFGDRLTYCGMISTQQTLPWGTLEECRAEARHRIDVIGRGGGYIFAPAHCIQPDAPVENVLAIYEELLGKKLL